MKTAHADTPVSAQSARERAIGAAYELFSRKGVRAVGVDAVIEEAGIAKATLYRNFSSKENLALAFLDRREQRWTEGWLQAEVERRDGTPQDRLLSIFDIFGEWFARPDFEGCAFVSIMLEFEDRADPVRQATVRHPVSYTHLTLPTTPYV